MIKKVILLLLAGALCIATTAQAKVKHINKVKHSKLTHPIVDSILKEYYKDSVKWIEINRAENVYIGDSAPVDEKMQPKITKTYDYYGNDGVSKDSAGIPFNKKDTVPYVNKRDAAQKLVDSVAKLKALVDTLTKEEKEDSTVFTFVLIDLNKFISDNLTVTQYNEGGYGQVLQAYLQQKRKAKYKNQPVKK